MRRGESKAWTEVHTASSMANASRASVIETCGWRHGILPVLYLRHFDGRPKARVLGCMYLLIWVPGRLAGNENVAFRRPVTAAMASFLTAFDAQLAKYLEQLQELQEKNQKQHLFQPTFWLQQADFDVAREVFVAVCAR